MFPEAVQMRSQDLDALFFPTGTVWVWDVAATEWGTIRYLQMNRLVEVVAILSRFAPGTMGQVNNNRNQTIFQRAKEDR